MDIVKTENTNTVPSLQLTQMSRSDNAEQDLKIAQPLTLQVAEFPLSGEGVVFSLSCPGDLWHHATMRLSGFLLVLACHALANPATAQTAMDSLPGIYGSASDPALSCAANPHLLDVTGPRPHVELTWEHPAEDPEAGVTLHSRYDVLTADAGSISLRREGSTLRADGGGPVIWLLRPTAAPDGYCWGRADRPIVYCERQQIRCGDAAPSS